MARTSFDGPIIGQIVPMVFTFGQSQLTATTVLDWEAPFACRIMAISHACSAEGGASTLEVDTAGGAVIAASLINTAGLVADISGATSANRDVAAGAQIVITWTDVGGSATVDDLVVCIVVQIKGFMWTDGATSNEADD